MLCGSCGDRANYVIINGFNVTVCTQCAEVLIPDAEIIIRLDRGLWAHTNNVQAQFIAVAAAMQKISANWDTVAPRVPSSVSS